MTDKAAEQEELARAVERLGPQTRPGRLLGYMGAKYFQQQEGQLTELAIAVEVFGRSPKTFDASDDAIARVEAHRLRKRLRHLYAEGAGIGGLQISLPAGSYVPRFSLPAVSPTPDQPDTSADSAKNSSDARLEENAHTGVRAQGFRKLPIYLATAAAAVAVIAMAVTRRIEHEQPAPPAQSKSISAKVSDSVAERSDEVHIMAGYSGSEVIDSSGVSWTSDRYFSGGGAWPTGRGFLRGTSRQFLFANWRNGQFGYSVPLKPGTYEMRLYFVSSLAVGDEQFAGFKVSMNGKAILDEYDVNSSAHGPDVADEKVFKDVVPAPDGFVHLAFDNQQGVPSVSALEFVPGTPGKLKPIRISTQPTSFVDHKGQRWRADDYFINGQRSTQRRKVSGTDDPELFVSERYGHFIYAIPVDARGRYTVVLHFAEFYFGAQAAGSGGIGRRVFNVYCNGNTLLKDFDIYKEGGSLRLVSRTFSNIQPSAQGKINLTFEPVINNATVSAIEVLDESIESQ